MQEAGWRMGRGKAERIWRREVLKAPQKPKPRGCLWLNDGLSARLRQRGELVERSLANAYETGGMRRVQPRLQVGRSSSAVCCSRTYGPMKSVADCFKYATKQGLRLGRRRSPPQSPAINTIVSDCFASPRSAGSSKAWLRRRMRGDSPPLSNRQKEKKLRSQFASGIAICWRSKSGQNQSGSWPRNMLCPTSPFTNTARK